MAKLTAEEAIDRLVAGNRKYQRSRKAFVDVSTKTILKLRTMQEPYAVVIACSDSRVVPEKIFMAGIGDIFVIQIAGNVIREIGLGSIEYAVEHLETKLVLLLGHSNCGAIGAAIEGHGEHHIGIITSAILDAIGDETDSDRAAVKNVVRGMEAIMASNVVRENIPRGLKLVCGHYHMHTGAVDIIPKSQFEDMAPHVDSSAYLDYVPITRKKGLFKRRRRRKANPTNI